MFGLLLAAALQAAPPALPPPVPPEPPPAFAPGVSYDPSLPTLRQVVGHDWGEEITTADEVVAYLRALTAAAPDRSRLVEYARSWEGRPLHVLIV